MPDAHSASRMAPARFPPDSYRRGSFGESCSRLIAGSGPALNVEYALQHPHHPYSQELDVERVKQTGRVDLAAGVRVRISPEATLLLKLLRRELDQLVLNAAAARGVAADAGAAIVKAIRALLARH
jgi:hypothetical protein